MRNFRPVTWILSQMRKQLRYDCEISFRQVAIDVFKNRTKYPHRAFSAASHTRKRRASVAIATSQPFKKVMKGAAASTENRIGRSKREGLAQTKWKRKRILRGVSRPLLWLRSKVHFDVTNSQYKNFELLVPVVVPREVKFPPLAIESCGGRAYCARKRIGIEPAKVRAPPPHHTPTIAANILVMESVLIEFLLSR